MIGCIRTEEERIDGCLVDLLDGCLWTFSIRGLQNSIRLDGPDSKPQTSDATWEPPASPVEHLGRFQIDCEHGAAPVRSKTLPT